MEKEEQQRFQQQAEASSIKTVKIKTYKNLIILSTGFLFLFTAFQALQNLQSSLHDDRKLGLASLCVIYASLVTSCMFVPPLLINRLGYKYTVMLSMSGYVVYTVANFYPRYWTLIPASAFLGFCGAPLWSAKCAYVTTSGIKYSKAANLNQDYTITNFFGIFFLIFQSGQIWGNLISSQILKPSGGKTNLSLDVSEICGAHFCPSTPISPQNQQTSRSTVITLMSIYLTFGCLAIAVVFFFLDKCKQENESAQKTGVCDLFVATFKHVRNRKMQLLIPLTVFSGLEQGFVFSDFTKAFVTCSIGIEMVGLVMICFGVVDAFFSLFLGKIVEWWTGRPLMMLCGAIINLAILIVFLVWRPSEDSLYVYFVAAGFWGFADAVWQTQVNAFYGVLFASNQEAAFSNYRLWESLGFVISFAYGDYICTDIKIYVLIVTLVVGISFYGVIELMRKQESQEVYNVSMQSLPDAY